MPKFIHIQSFFVIMLVDVIISSYAFSALSSRSIGRFCALTTQFIHIYAGTKVLVLGMVGVESLVKWFLHFFRKVLQKLNLICLQ